MSSDMESGLLNRAASVAAPRRSPSLRDYLTLARLDHSTKHIFIAPGFALAYVLRGGEAGIGTLATQVLLGLLTAVSLASANYVINEYLDRESDRHHPIKSLRRAVQCELRGSVVLLEWLAFLIVGLTVALTASTTMFVIAVAFALQGVVYNVAPIRLKDKPFLDVISESVNNPLRLLIGWAMVDPTTLPPSSLLLSYWLGGAFLMTAKRYSEYREIVASHGRDLLIRYRASFSGYSESSLLVACFIYGLLSTFFLAIFLIKYRVEYLLLMPLAIVLFSYYLVLAMRPNSAAQHPEKLLRAPALMLLIVVMAAVFVATTMVDIPALSAFTSQQYIKLY